MERASQSAVRPVPHAQGRRAGAVLNHKQSALCDQCALLDSCSINTGRSVRCMHSCTSRVNTACIPTLHAQIIMNLSQ